MSIESFPLINATLNGMATILLVWAGFAIYRKRDETLHRNLMLAALVCSAAFLTCYLYYHAHAGSVPYKGQGVLRYIYFAILITHVPLAGLMVPFILISVYNG